MGWTSGQSLPVENFVEYPLFRNKYMYLNLSHSVLPGFQGPPHHRHFHLLDYHWSHYSPNSFLPV